MSEPGIEYSSPLEAVVPRNRMKVAIFPAFISGFIHLHQYLNFIADIFIVIPFIPTNPLFRQEGGSGVGRVENMDRRLLNFGVAGEVSADHLAIPGPFIFRVGRGMNAQKPIPILYIPLKSFLLRII